jgi:hypothetical protein
MRTGCACVAIRRLQKISAEAEAKAKAGMNNIA